MIRNEKTQKKIDIDIDEAEQRFAGANSTRDIKYTSEIVVYFRCKCESCHRHQHRHQSGDIHYKCLLFYLIQRSTKAFAEVTKTGECKKNCKYFIVLGHQFSKI